VQVVLGYFDTKVLHIVPLNCLWLSSSSKSAQDLSSTEVKYWSEREKKNQSKD